MMTQFQSRPPIFYLGQIKEDSDAKNVVIRITVIAEEEKIKNKSSRWII